MYCILASISFQKSPYRSKRELKDLRNELYQHTEWRKIESFKDLIFTVKLKLIAVIEEIERIS